MPHNVRLSPPNEMARIESRLKAIANCNDIYSVLKGFQLNTSVNPKPLARLSKVYKLDSVIFQMSIEVKIQDQGRIRRGFLKFQSDSSIASSEQSNKHFHGRFLNSQIQACLEATNIICENRAEQLWT